MADFLTVEDVNSVIGEYYTVSFWSSVDIGTGESTVDFTDVKFDYLEVDRTYDNGSYTFTISVDNDLWSGKCYFHNSNDEYISNATYSNSVITVVSDTPDITANFYFSLQETFGFQLMDWIITSWTPKFERVSERVDFVGVIESVNSDFEPNGKSFKFNGISITCSNNKIVWSQSSSTWFNFTCTYNNIGYTFYPKAYHRIRLVEKITQTLKIGKINTIEFFTDINFPSTSNISISCDYPISNVKGHTIGGAIQRIYCDIDLRNVSNLEKIKLQVKYESSNDYFFDEIVFDTEYATITLFEELSDLFSNGGVGRLGADISLTGDLTLTKDVMLIGNDKTLTMANHKIIVPTDKTLKVEDTILTGGKHTIHQNKDSNVELTDCTFTNCLADNGHGAVIDCGVDLESLSIPMDFTTSLTHCLISNCDMAILHGGDLTITKCIVTGKISNPSYPYFLYQTDGNADITQSQFNIESDSQIESDIEFNSCIFICGTDALINNLTREELSKNNVTSFLSDARNSSSIDLTYYYDAIEDYITLQGTGYCHSISEVDFVFKTGITPRRRE